MSNRHDRFPEQMRGMSAPDLARVATTCLLRIMDHMQAAKTPEEADLIDLDDLYGDLMQTGVMAVARLRVLALERANIELLHAAQVLAQETSMCENIIRNAAIGRAQKQGASGLVPAGANALDILGGPGMKWQK